MSLSDPCAPAAALAKTEEPRWLRLRRSECERWQRRAKLFFTGGAIAGLANVVWLCFWPTSAFILGLFTLVSIWGSSLVAGVVYQEMAKHCRAELEASKSEAVAEQ